MSPNFQNPYQNAIEVKSSIATFNDIQLNITCAIINKTAIQKAGKQILAYNCNAKSNSRNILRLFLQCRLAVAIISKSTEKVDKKYNYPYETFASYFPFNKLNCL